MDYFHPESCPRFIYLKKSSCPYFFDDIGFSLDKLCQVFLFCKIIDTYIDIDPSPVDHKHFNSEIDKSKTTIEYEK